MRREQISSTRRGEIRGLPRRATNRGARRSWEGPNHRRHRKARDNMHHKVEYASDYLVPGVALPAGPGFHQITLRWDRDHPEAVGSFFIDPNACGLDAFGDPTICTKIAVSLRDMKLALLAEKP